MNNQHPQHTISGGGVNPSTQAEFTFKGPKLEECDLPRLGTDARKVWDIMVGNTYPEQHRRCYGWYDLNQLAAILKKPHSSLSAAVRAFRYPENGGHKVDTRRETEGSGTWLYKLIPNTPDGVKLAKAAAKAKKVKTDELLTLKDWLVSQLNAGAWNHSSGAVTLAKNVASKIDEMVKERKA